MSVSDDGTKFSSRRLVTRGYENPLRLTASLVQDGTQKNMGMNAECQMIRHFGYSRPYLKLKKN